MLINSYTTTWFPSFRQSSILKIFLMPCYHKRHEFKLKLMSNYLGILGGFDRCMQSLENIYL